MCVVCTVSMCLCVCVLCVLYLCVRTCVHATVCVCVHPLFGVFVCISITFYHVVKQRMEPIAVSKFPAYVQEMHKDRDLGFETEYGVS